MNTAQASRFLFIVTIAFMNLVTAVIVEKAIASAEGERELRMARERHGRVRASIFQ